MLYERIKASITSKTVNNHYYRYTNVYRVFENMPECGDEIDGATILSITPVDLDPEQPGDLPWCYAWYELELADYDVDEDEVYDYTIIVAVELPDTVERLTC